MLALKIGFLLAIILLVQTQDVDWLPCFQKALVNGAPEINVPGHDPLHIPRNISFSQKILLFTASGYINQLTWYNIPWWTVREFTEIYNDDNFFVYEFHLHWENFSLTADYDLALKSILENIELQGQVVINMTGVDWTGTFNISKATNDSLEHVNDLQVKWENDDVDVEVTHLELIELLLDISVKASFEAFIALVNIENLVGTLFTAASNDRWLSNATRMEALRQWCLDNP